MTKKRLILLGTLLLIVVVISFLVLTSNRSVKSKGISISGISKCSKGVDAAIIDRLGTTLYGSLVLANDFNKATTQPNYEGEVRKGSCEQKESHAVTADTGERLIVKRSSVIVDIPQAKQSWRIAYDWVGGGDATKVDLGMPTVGCLAIKELRYGDFNCQKVLNIQKYGTPDYDPILEYMPYSGKGFNLAYTPSSRQVVASIIIPSKQKDNQELIENSKAVIPYWFNRRGLDINKYTIVYRVVYE